MRYMGGKARIAKDLARVMLSIAPQREVYLEPFLGGCHVLPLMAPHFSMSIASDVMPDVAMLWRHALAGWRPPSEVTPEMYAELRNAEPSALRGFVGFACSFGGKWFGGMAKHSPGHWTLAGQIEILDKHVTSLDPARTIIRQHDYRDHAPTADIVVYCDPPYAGTTTYKNAPPWDADEFWRVMATWVEAGAIVFVSEYAAPDGWVPVWTKTAAVGSLRKDGNADPVTEHLFMHVSQAPTDIPTGVKPMASTSEELRNEAERQAKARRAAVEAAQDATGDLGPYEGGDYARMARALHAGIIAMAESWRQHAIACETSKKRSEGVSFRNGLRAAAELAAGFAGGLISPEFIASLQQEVSSERPVDYPEAVAMAEIDRDAAEIVDNTLAYIKGDTDVLAGPDIPGSFGPGDRIPDPDPAHVVAAIQSLAPQTFVMPELVDPTPVVPPRMTWEEFALAVSQLPPPANGSFSMITSLADCGMRYALDRLARRDLANVPPEIPAWWNVGGTAFHMATETIERWVIAHPGEELIVASVDDLWKAAFAKSIAETQHESGIPTERWRAAKKGSENYDWWRVSGADMVRKYLAYHTPEYRAANRILVAADGTQALELKLTLDLAGWPFETVLDQVWATPTGLRIRDLKSGGTKQPSTFQLGGYAWALRQEIKRGNPFPSGVSVLEPPISGAFWDARAGSHDMEVDNLIGKHPMAELMYRAHAAKAQVEQRAYLPRVSNFGGGCTSCPRLAICPAKG